MESFYLLVVSPAQLNPLTSQFESIAEDSDPDGERVHLEEFVHFDKIC